MTKIYWIQTMGVVLGKVLCLSFEINFKLHWKGCYLAVIDKKSLSLKRKPCFLLCFYQKPCLFNSKTLKRKCSWQSLQMEFQTIQAISKGNILSMENYQYWMLTTAKVKRLSKPSCVGLVAPSTNPNTEEPPCWAMTTHSRPFSTVPQAFAIPTPSLDMPFCFFHLSSLFPSQDSCLPLVWPTIFEDFIKIASRFLLPLSELIYSPGWGSRHPPSAVPSLWCSALSFTTQLIKRQVCLHCLPFSGFLLPCSTKAQFPPWHHYLFLLAPQVNFQMSFTYESSEKKNQTFKKKLIIKEKNIRATLRKERSSMQNKWLAEACRDGYSHLPTWITDLSCTFNLARANVRKAGHGIWKTISSAWEKKPEILKSPIVLLCNSFSNQVIIYLGNF